MTEVVDNDNSKTFLNMHDDWTPLPSDLHYPCGLGFEAYHFVSHYDYM